jgi:hypothetical protein
MSMRHVKDRIAMNEKHAKEHRQAARSVGGDKKRSKFHASHAEDHMKDLKKARKHLSKVKEV